MALARESSVGEQTANKPTFCIRNRDDDANLSRCRISRRIHARDLPAKRATGIAVDRERHRSADSHLRELFSRNRSFEPHARWVDDREEQRARLNYIAR